MTNLTRPAERMGSEECLGKFDVRNTCLPPVRILFAWMRSLILGLAFWTAPWEKLTRIMFHSLHVCLCLHVCKVCMLGGGSRWLQFWISLAWCVCRAESLCPSLVWCLTSVLCSPGSTPLCRKIHWMASGRLRTFWVTCALVERLSNMRVYKYVLNEYVYMHMYKIWKNIMIYVCICICIYI